MRTPEDIVNHKEANQRYYKLEKNKEQKRQKMYMMIKSGNIPSKNEENNNVSSEWEQKIDTIES